MQVKDTPFSFRLWAMFCRSVVRLFYRRVEVHGDPKTPAKGGIIYCANHVNALVDPVIVQALTPHALKPLARSGLFHSPYAPILKLIGAIPVYRPGDKDVKASQNRDMFSAVTELLAQNENVIIFPEGQSHSDSHLSKIKSGAARIAISALGKNTHAPLVVPVGLTFSNKGRFRSDVLLNFGEPIDPADIDQSIRNEKRKIVILNKQIAQGLQRVTLNADSWQDLRLARLLERFFAVRRGKLGKTNLSQRFGALQRIIDGQAKLRAVAPRRVKALTRKLITFDRLCQTLGIESYHLSLEYRPMMILRYVFRSLLVLILGLPLALLGAINGLAPFYLTEFMTQKFAKGEDQVDTARIMLSIFWFGLFWLAQGVWVYRQFGLKWMLIYAVFVFISSLMMLSMREQIGGIWRNIRIFFMFLRKRNLREFITMKRDELSLEVAQITRLAKRLSKKTASEIYLSGKQE